ncbi:MAG TPA: SRPBCC domain-containing protein [Planctomycetota bacterium]|nr:SRPBCC domain-containing protein [Planctomycetota bacterium]
MSMQRDPDGRRSVRVEVEVPGTPEQVWQAIATGPGISAWFVPTKVDGREGGEVVSDFGGGMISTAKITAYEPPFRLAAEAPGWTPGMPTMATEWTVEARRGGTCVVRVVHSLFASTDDWDQQLEGTESGWPSFFRVLVRYLRHFAGQPSALVQASATTQAPVGTAWPALLTAMGGQPRPGQRLSLAIAPNTVLAGKVDRVDDLGHGFNVEVLLEQPTSGTMLAGAYACGGTMVQVSAYMYGSDAERSAALVRQHLAPWLTARFPAPAAGG